MSKVDEIKALAHIIAPLWTAIEWDGFTPPEEAAIEMVKERLTAGSCIRLQPPDPDDIEVILQRIYAGDRPVLPSVLADIPCSRFSAKQLLLLLNSLLYTAYPLIDPLSGLLEYYAEKANADFGTLYAQIRRYWSNQDFHAFEEKRITAQKDMHNCRHSMIDKTVIRRPEVAPRRFWDLYSNRVIDASLLSRHWPGAPRGVYLCKPGSTIHCLPPIQWSEVYAVSHSWARPDERLNILTPINACEWRVPIPRGVTLEHVRVELLNLGAEYAWLDLLCLRQEDAEAQGEKYRRDEWALDVPTIGRVYDESHNVIHYFSGLGKPFVLGDLGSDRHWLNRAWTLQEIGMEDFRTTAGITKDSPPDPWGHEVGSGPFYETLAIADGIMADKLQATNSPEGIRAAFQSMRARQCVSPIDRISGLAYALGCVELPVYDTSWSLEQAWEAFIVGLDHKSIMIIAMLFQLPGRGKFRFLPSWQQVMECELSAWATISESRCTRMFQSFFPRADGRFELVARGSLIPQCQLKGLGGKGVGTRQKRRGRATMRTRTGKVMWRNCHSTVPIPDGTYDLLTFIHGGFMDNEKETSTVWMRKTASNFMWLVGHVVGDQFMKESVCELCDLTYPKDWDQVVHGTVQNSGGILLV